MGGSYLAHNQPQPRWPFQQDQTLHLPHKQLGSGAGGIRRSHLELTHKKSFSTKGEKQPARLMQGPSAGLAPAVDTAEQSCLIRVKTKQKKAWECGLPM